jgi:hypothetical protein
MNYLSYFRIAVSVTIVLLIAALADGQSVLTGSSTLRQPTPQEGTVDAVGKFIPRVGGTTTNSPLPRTREEAEASLKQSLDFKKTGPDTYVLGHIALNAKDRTVAIPAFVNMRHGLLEYALVTATGKRHESLFYTTERADQIHLACVLLGLDTTSLTPNLQEPLHPSAANAVEVEVTWDKHGAPAHFPLARLVCLTTPGTSVGSTNTLAQGAWLYNGSVFGQAGFAAQQEGSIISLISDPVALINNPGVDRSDDDIHVPNELIVPPEGAPVRVILKFNSPAKP